MLAASLIICSHNPRPTYLARTLESLRRQDMADDRWELLIIDNASAQPLADALDISWHRNGRHVLEPELGLASARQRGMREASSELLVFVDDDNVLAPNYLSEAVRIGQDWPWLGTWGSGAIIPEFELQPRKHLEKLIPNLALREVAAPRWSNIFPCTEATPWGAGLCVRKKVAEAYSQAGRGSLHISDRRGKSLLSGGDVEICYAGCDAGLGMGVFPELKLTHLIPKERVSEDYLLRLFEGIIASNYMLSYKWKRLEPWSPFRARALLSVLKNTLLRRGIERRMYFAGVRAALRARQTIAASQSPRS
ncbi:Glycosyltransferase, GT2 family [Rhizobiales bacterium GAS188]|nr:Glycosyltransferase, GT2 family [Rhizobiales bacterium GAS188]